MKKTLLLFVSILTMSFVNAQDFTVDDIEYNIVESNAEVRGYVGSGTTVNIPASVDNGGVTYAVTGIVANAFDVSTKPAASTITSVILPNTITIIRARAFKESNITSITIPSSVETIAGFAFINCDELTTITIPSTVTTIGGNGILRYCDKLETINFEAPVAFINNSTFADNPLLKTVRITSTQLTSLGNDMFLNCPALTGIEMAALTPPSVTTGSNPTFSGISSTAILYVPTAAAKTAYEGSAEWNSAFGNGARIVVGTLGADTVEQELGFSFYPNPTQDVVYVENSKSINTEVTVFDLNGRTLLTKDISNKKEEINISNLTSGVYLFKVKSDTSELVKRIVKQ